VTFAAELLLSRTEANSPDQASSVTSVTANAISADVESPPLYDVQGYADTRGVALSQAGVKAVQMPLVIEGQLGQTQTVAASANLSVFLNAEQKGTHMSRFVIQLSEWTKDRPINRHFDAYLTDMCQRLESPSAQLSLSYKYFVLRQAPVSDMAAPMAYDAQYLAHQHNGTTHVTLGVEVPIATVCPCSKAISKYGAHNQRVMVRAWVNTQLNGPMVWPVQLIETIEQCASCPVYPLLKRQDEKYVTERGYENAKFVEDVARELTLLLRAMPGVTGFKMEVEALESIHAHNAWTFHEEQFVGP
jgi:GTP cyclohydrolase IB